MALPASRFVPVDKSRKDIYDKVISKGRIYEVIRTL